MRSNELAKLAGVTVRTLRHYHQIGLLDEPERSENGYRDYTVGHLATVLRIVSFTDLGVPLGEVQRALDDAEAADELLERMDRQARAEIARLTARRREIAVLRAHGAAPDLPAALVPHARMLREQASANPAGDRHERELLALIGHLSADGALPGLARAYERSGAAAGDHAALMRRFEAIAPDSECEEHRELIDQLVAAIAAVVRWEEVPSFDAEATALLVEHQDAHMNPAQRLVWARVSERLEELRAQAAAGE